MYLAHASTNYIIRYIETHHVDVSLSSACCRDGSCEVHEPQRQTSENVFLIYKAARHPRVSFVATVQRYEKVSKVQNKKALFLFLLSNASIFDEVRDKKIPNRQAIRKLFFRYQEPAP